MDRTLVFVYGTLKRGFPNHGLVDDLIRSGDASFVSVGRTAGPLPLVCGPNGIPFLLNLPGSGERVRGELYAVSARGISRMDELEGTRRSHYERLPLAVIPSSSSCGGGGGGGGGAGGGEEIEDEEAVQAEAYFAHRSYAEEMWGRSEVKGLSSYSEASARAYVKPSDRPRDTTFLDHIRIFISGRK